MNTTRKKRNTNMNNYIPEPMKERSRGFGRGRAVYGYCLVAFWLLSETHQRYRHRDIRSPRAFHQTQPTNRWPRRGASGAARAHRCGFGRARKWKVAILQETRVCFVWFDMIFRVVGTQLDRPCIVQGLQTQPHSNTYQQPLWTWGVCGAATPWGPLVVSETHGSVEQCVGVCCCGRERD